MSYYILTTYLPASESAIIFSSTKMGTPFPS